MLPLPPLHRFHTVKYTPKDVTPPKRCHPSTASTQLNVTKKMSPVPKDVTPPTPSPLPPSQTSQRRCHPPSKQPPPTSSNISCILSRPAESGCTTMLQCYTPQKSFLAFGKKKKEDLLQQTQLFFCSESQKEISDNFWHFYASCPFRPAESGCTIMLQCYTSQHPFLATEEKEGRPSASSQLPPFPPSLLLRHLPTVSTFQLFSGCNFFRVATFFGKLFSGFNFFRVSTFFGFQLFSGNFFRVSTFFGLQLFSGCNFFQIFFVSLSFRNGRIPVAARGRQSICRSHVNFPSYRAL